MTLPSIDNALDTLTSVTHLLDDGETQEAANLMRDEYPRSTANPGRKSRQPQEMLTVFHRDHFTDRYDGTRLVNRWYRATLSVMATP
jgi:hypothetical protein